MKEELKNQNKLWYLFDYLFILRPFILIPVWNFFLIGNHLASPEHRLALKSFLGLAVYTMLMGGIYILNQITDIDTDRLNRKLFILSENHLPIRNAYIEMFFLWFSALLLAWFFGYLFFIIAIISLIIGVLYSLPPVKLKGKPFLDTLSNGFGYGVINFAAGWVMQRPLEAAAFMKFLPYFLSISAVFINTTIVDMAGDKKAGEITTAVFLSEARSYVVSFILMISAILLSLHQKDLICLIPAALSTPLFLYAAIHNILKGKISRSITIASFRLPGLIITIITCILYPVIIPFIVLVILGMKIYYKKRFGINYPTLSRG